jgi:hypothetical protein
MPTLVIHAPRRAVVAENRRTFESTFEKGVGDRYAIFKRLTRQLHPGCPVILLSKDEKKQAEGTLVKLEPLRTVTKNGVPTYDVHIENLKRVHYRGENITLNRCGVAVIE